MSPAPDDVVKQAETLAEATEDEAVREILTGLLTAFGKLQRGYNYVCHEGKEPNAPPLPLNELPSLDQLSAKWCREADSLREYGVESVAEALERCAADLDSSLRAYERERLALPQAVEESGYSAKRLRELVREGKIPDTRPEGSQGEIRIRRGDLPRKPGMSSKAAAETPADRLLARVAG